MFVSKVRGDGVFDGLVEFPDGTNRIPSGHTFSLPPEIPEGFHAVMRGGWVLVEGEAPVFPKPPSPEEIANQLIKSVTDLTQKRLDDFASTRNYDNTDSIAKYKDITDEEIAAMPEEERSLVLKFRTECRYLASLTARTWARLYIIMGEVQDGIRPMPSGYSEIEPELPPLTWPI